MTIHIKKMNRINLNLIEQKIFTNSSTVNIRNVTKKSKKKGKENGKRKIQELIV